MQLPFNDLINFLRQISICAGFSAMDLEQFALYCQFAGYESGSCLFKENDHPDYFYIIFSGKVKISKTEPVDHEIILSVLGKGDCFGELAIVDNSLRNANAYVLQDAEFLLIDQEAFLLMAGTNAKFTFNLLKSSLTYLKEANQLSRCLSFCSSEKTIMNVLFRLAVKCGQLKDNLLIIPPVLSHQQMANMAGTSRKNFTMTLKALEEKKLIRRCGESREKMDIYINNYDQIKKMFG